MTSLLILFFMIFWILCCIHVDIRGCAPLFAFGGGGDVASLSLPSLNETLSLA